TFDIQATDNNSSPTFKEDSSLVVLLDFIIFFTAAYLPEFITERPNANSLEINVDILEADKADEAEADEADEAEAEEAKEAEEAEKTKEAEEAEIVVDQHVLHVMQIQEVSLEQILSFF
ncbi:9535_t:CDS:2, partial [Scutellospora calospora]